MTDRSANYNVEFHCAALVVLGRALGHYKQPAEMIDQTIHRA
ncbi:MAG: hypothetical protein ACFBZ9_01045 [Sphingomonadales bacterium]